MELDYGKPMGRKPDECALQIMHTGKRDFGDYTPNLVQKYTLAIFDLTVSVSSRTQLNSLVVSEFTKGFNLTENGLIIIQVVLLWCHQESNRGHKDFQSFALPSEL